MADFKSLLPSERPQIGERVKLRSGILCGCEGFVSGYKDNKTEMKYRKILVLVKAMEREYTVQVPRSDLLDAEGNPMPDYLTEQEKKTLETERHERKEQYKRLEDAMKAHGYDLEDYLRYSIGEYAREVHSEDIERLKNGEERIDKYFDENICEGLGFGLDWILYGDENCKEHPCGEQMMRYLNGNPDRRARVWKWMQEDGYKIRDYYDEMRERDEMEFGEVHEEFEQDEYDE